MELVEGVTLAERMRTGPIPLAELVTLAIELLDVLAAAHERKIVHRDIKPENLLIQADGRLRVLDFGVAKFEGSVLTEKGELIGTALYMAPEQVRGDEIDARVDVFAVGATMFHAIAGRPIHVGPSAGEIILLAATGSPPALASVASVPEELGMVVDCALSFDPIDRYKDARAMQVELRALGGRLKGRTASRPPPRIARDEDDAEVPEDVLPTMITHAGSKKT
jgi:serine/threonine protein kinase